MNAPAQPRGKRFQISLATATLIILELSAVVLLVIHCRSWIPEQRLRSASGIKNTIPQIETIGGHTSPDRTRWLIEWWIEDTSLKGKLFDFTRRDIDGSRCSPLKFVDDDTVVVLVYDEDREGKVEHKFRIWRRRFPEWWWGHFYRPEVWLAIILGGLLVWRGIRAVRQRRPPAATPA
ncbi:MAG TPA: hypothetical protein VEJ63_12610 [Planctomycetota bacterium]|nr:hypothetical protein [Planctomycetota bacterium]